MRNGADLFRAGVVVDNAPALGKLAKDERKQTMRLFSIRHDELKPAANKGCIRAKKLHLQDR